MSAKTSLISSGALQAQMSLVGRRAAWPIPGRSPRACYSAPANASADHPGPSRLESRRPPTTYRLRRKPGIRPAWVSHAARKSFRIASDSRRGGHRKPLGIQVAANVRFTPKSGHARCIRPCLLWAKSGHCATYSITSVARASRSGGTLRPRALAALRLITNSNLVGA